VKGELLFGIHCHQPVDNFSTVVDEAIKNCYMPFIKGVLPYKNFRFSVHFSGWLLEYIEKNAPELFSMLKLLSSENRIEFSSGGFYEPILASIPSKDRVDQIKKLNKYIKKSFGKTPTSMWLTERVWEDSIIEDIKKCGIESIFVDDYHFFTAGFKDSDIDGYFVSEGSGETINVYPINKELRYAIPFRPTEELGAFFEEFFTKKSVGVLYDDGEKFGVWPGTYDWIYEQGWLEKFMSFLEEKNIKCSTFSEYSATHRPKGLVYLPSVSYYEMGEWSLPSKAGFDFEILKDELKNKEGIDRFLKGGIWKNFFVKYYESNRLHKKVLTLSKLRGSIKSKEFDDCVFRAECNDVFWHGVFGGIYLPNLRDNAYRFVAEAENIRYANIATPTILLEDFNLDGVDEIKCVTKNHIYSLDMGKGGSICELLDRERLHNFQNTMSRYKESYHYKALELMEGKEESHSHGGIDSIHSMDIEKLKTYKNMLVFDEGFKNSFVEFVSDYSFTLENYYDSSFKKYSDFSKTHFECISIERDRVVLEGETTIEGQDRFGVRLQKDFVFKDEGLFFELKLDSSCEYELRFICEFNFHFLNQEFVTIEGLDEQGRAFLPNRKTIVLKDTLLHRDIVLSFSDDVDFYIYRVDTLSQSESGFDVTKQGYTIGALLNYKRSFTQSGSMQIVESR